VFCSTYLGTAAVSTKVACSDCCLKLEGFYALKAPYALNVRLEIVCHEIKKSGVNCEASFLVRWRPECSPV